MAEQVKDHRGRRVEVGKRIRRLHPNGKHVKSGTSMVLDVRVDEQGRTVVDYEELKSLKRGTITVDRVEVLYNRKEPSIAERQYKVDKEAAEAVSKRVAKRRGGLLR